VNCATELRMTLIDDQQFVNYLRNNDVKNKNTHVASKNMDELKAKLEERGFDSELVIKFLRI
jgi:hypothetical protein